MGSRVWSPTAALLSPSNLDTLPSLRCAPGWDLSRLRIGISKTHRFPQFMRPVVCGSLLLFLAFELMASEATFLRGVNLNGPALTIDGRRWEGKSAAGVVVKGNTFENQAVPLKP